MVYSKESINILLIVEEQADFNLIYNFLQKSNNGNYILDWANTLLKAYEKIEHGKYDLLLVDYIIGSNSDFSFYRNLEKFHVYTPSILINSEDKFTIEKRTAKYRILDSLTKIEIFDSVLFRSIYYSIERNKIENKLVEKEDKFKSLFDGAPDAILLADAATGIIIDANPAANKLLGRNRNELVGLHQSKLHSFNSRFDDFTFIEFVNKLKKTKSAVKIEAFFLNSKSENIPVEMTSNLIKIDGRLVIQAIMRDITERRKFEKELIKAKDIAESATKSKSRFLANMSHEIRTPMNGIIGMTNILKSSVLTADQQEHLNLISVSSNNLLAIINDILDLSKIESDQLNLENIDFNLIENINDILKILNIKSKEKDIELKFTYDENIPVFVKGDPVRLNQIVLNLMNNGIKFTEIGSVSIHISLIEKVRNKIKIKFNVIDTGIGISKEGQKRLFKEFSQVYSYTTRKHGGTGLGLAISKKLAEKMNGNIGVESELGKGASFWFTVVLEQGKSYEKVGNDASEMQFFTIGTVLRILIAEDNIINQKVAKMTLEKMGHIVDVAENGEIAVEKFLGNDYDIILMDIQMPVMNGVDATRQIREIEEAVKKEKRIKIYAMTANVMKQDKEEYLASGMNDFISKPFKINELISILEK